MAPEITGDADALDVFKLVSKGEVSSKATNTTATFVFLEHRSATTISFYFPHSHCARSILLALFLYTPTTLLSSLPLLYVLVFSLSNVSVYPAPQHTLNSFITRITRWCG